MKKEGSLKSILAILVIVLVCLISLGGIYVKKNNVMKNVLPDYVLGKDLDGSIIVKLDVNKSEDSSEDTKEDENSDSEGDSQENNETQNTDENASEDQSETKTENGQAEQNIYTVENYNKTKQIIEKRLKIVGMENYELRLDEQTGSIVIEVPESSELSTIGSVIKTGKTELKIDETNEVIGDKNSIKNFKTSIDDSNKSSGYGSAVKIEIQFSKDAVKKFKELNDNYVAPVDENGTTTENKVSLLVDGTSIVSIEEKEFLESAVNGSVQLWGNFSTDNKVIDSALLSIDKVKMLIDTEDLPITYNANYVSEGIKSNINKTGVISVFAVLLIVMCVYLLIKYKLQGLLGELSIVGLGSLILLTLRFTKIEISISTIVAFVGMLILQFIYLTQILKTEKISEKVFNEKTGEYTRMLIPLLIFTIVAAIIPILAKSIIIPFGNIQEIANFGMVGFWGLILFELVNNILTKAMIVKSKNK